MKRKVYLIGIGGIAMANLACLLKRRGVLVSGSDLDTFGPSAELLKKNKISYFKDHSPVHIKKFKPDIVVIGNAIQRGNPGLEYVLNSRIPHCSMPEIIGEEIIGSKKSIVITGTSGKTTTASLVAWIFEKSGLKPTALVGGTMKNFDCGFVNGSGDYAVIEGDEYNSSFYDSNPKFIHYRPYHALITNIQMDHLDLYGSIENIYQAFRKLAKLIPESGSLILNKNNKYTAPLSKESRSRVITFGKNGDIEAKNIKYNPEGISFDLFLHHTRRTTVISPILGYHNVENILAAISLSLSAGVSLPKIVSAVKEFKGVKRRLETIYQNNKITIIDDFAHNPEKVFASLSALRSHFPKHKITAIFEPRTGSSRRKFFQDIYPSSFKSADTVYVADPYKKSALDKKEVFSSQKLVSDLNKNGTEAYFLKNADAIIAHVKKRLPASKSPSILIVMSSGEFDGIHKKLLDIGF